MSANRLAAARERLAEALRTGADTRPHRAAIRQLEEAARASAEKAVQVQQEADAHAAQAVTAVVEARTSALVTQAQHEVAAAVAHLYQER